MIQTVVYIVRVPEFGVYKEFSDQETAHTFATQLAQDYPSADIERVKYVSYFDQWEGVQ